jgi:dimethylaniline monooxygenase (N-oxide forming)
VIRAIGWKQELPFIDRETLILVEPDGQYKLYRMIVNPELPGLGTVGFNSSFITTLSADLPPSRSGS